MDLNADDKKTKGSESFPVKILLVDDREENLLALESIWRDENYDFVHANSGREALRILLDDIDFTLIIMDVVMPGMDGFETASFISKREKLKDIPIIFLTARGSDESLFRAYNIGAVDYISKPVIPDLLRAKVKVFIELSQKSKILAYRKEQLKLINRNLEAEIKERKASEKKIRALNQQLNKKLEELESLDAFTYSVSHDLKNPLTSISFLAQLLLMNYADDIGDEAKELITKIEKQVKRLDELIKDLLLFSRKGHKIEKVDVNMNEVVQSVVEEVKLSYRINGNFKFEIGELPIVKCDNGLIKQVWSNLISNAVKYSKDKEDPLIKIEAHQENEQVIFSIHDNGIGFETKDSDQLFKVFNRLESAKKYEGSGVGLAIVKRIIERHGGNIWASSVPGKGTTFSFVL